MIRKKFIKILMMSSVLLGVTSCNDNISNSTSGSESSSTAPEVSSSIAYEDEKNLPSYEKVDRMSNYKGDDNYRNFYHIFVPSFADSNGDGVGDLQGIIDNLDYLRKENDPHGYGSLGIDSIFLSPIQDAMDYHKYNIRDYLSIDPQFGNMETFKTLLKECHKRGIKVIMDFVLNHCSTFNEYFIKARKALNNADENGRPTKEDIAKCPEIDYFRFIKPRHTFDDYSNRLFYVPMKQGQWKFEGFSDSMPDWNLDNPKVRELHKKYLEYYLDLGVDGFRLDAVQSFYGEEKILVDKNCEYLNYINKVVKDKKKDAYIVAEGPWSLAECQSYMRNTSIDSYFNFDLGATNLAGKLPNYFQGLRNGNLKPKNLKALLDISEFESKIDSKHIDANFSSNHDIGRVNNQFVLSNRCFLDGLKYHYALQYMLKGNFFLYYGDEIGLTGMKENNDDRPCRSPFIFSENSKYNTDPLRPDLNERTKANFEPLDKQIDDPNSLFRFIAKCTRVRDFHPEIARGSSKIVRLGTDVDKVSIIEKSFNGKSIKLVLNSGENEIHKTLSELNLKGEIENCLTVTNVYTKLTGDELVLPPLSITIMR